MFKLYYAPGTCALATHIALEEAGAPYEDGAGRFRLTGPEEPRVPRGQPERTGAGTGNGKWNFDRNTRFASVRGAAFSTGRTRAAIGFLRARPSPGVQ